MILFPAIDIKNGKVVRLRQGQFDAVTEYSNDPVAMAKYWEAQGAQWLHIVDLDGAQTGVARNAPMIASIAKAVLIPIQIGGGIRTSDQISDLIDAGVARVILGTKVVEDLDFVKGMIDRWGPKIAVSLDCARGFVAQRGWTQTSDLKAVDLVDDLERLGLSCLIYTDIARDGMLTGPNFEGLRELAAQTNVPIIASGGIADIEDIKKLKAMEGQGIIGAITGKALYEDKLNFIEALKAARG